MKVTIDFSPEQIAGILAYEMEGMERPEVNAVNAAWVRAKVIEHIHATSETCIQHWGRLNPDDADKAESWAKRVAKRVTRRRKPAYGIQFT